MTYVLPDETYGSNFTLQRFPAGDFSPAQEVWGSPVSGAPPSDTTTSKYCSAGPGSYQQIDLRRSAVIWEAYTLSPAAPSGFRVQATLRQAPLGTLIEADPTLPLAGDLTGYYEPINAAANSSVGPLRLEPMRPSSRTDRFPAHTRGASEHQPCRSRCRAPALL